MYCLSSTRTPGRSAANSSSSVRTTSKSPRGKGGRTIPPSAVRRSSPCNPATAGTAVPRKPSICSMGRPVTIATAPPSASRNATNSEGKQSGTSTASASARDRRCSRQSRETMPNPGTARAESWSSPVLMGAELCPLQSLAVSMGYSADQRQIPAPNNRFREWVGTHESGGWCRRRDSNSRPMHYECIALPTELLRPGSAPDYRQGTLHCKGANRGPALASRKNGHSAAVPAAAGIGCSSSSSAEAVASCGKALASTRDGVRHSIASKAPQRSQTIDHAGLALAQRVQSQAGSGGASLAC